MTDERAKTATPSAEHVARWVACMDACEQFLLAGLRREIGPEGDLRAAYRRWYAQQMEEHDRMMLRMMERFAEAFRDEAKRQSE